MKLLNLVLIAALFLSVPMLASSDPDRKARGAQALADSDFAAAESIYRELLDASPEEGEFHYRLAIALIGQERLDDAADSLERAGELGFQPLGVGYRLARIKAVQGDTEEALIKLKEVADAGFPAPALIENEKDFDSIRDEAAYQDALAQIRSNRYPCRDNPGKRGFDFWAGDWGVSSVGQAAGDNRIEAILEGCVLLENWTSVSGQTGKSFNYYDPGYDHWRQIWVDDTGGILEFTGQIRDGVMYYEAETRNADSGAITLHKMTFTPNEDGSVRQLMEQSADQGSTWQTVFDGRYERKSTSGVTGGVQP